MQALQYVLHIYWPKTNSLPQTKRDSTFFHPKNIMWVNNGNVPKQSNGGHLHQCVSNFEDYINILEQSKVFSSNKQVMKIGRPNK